MRKTNDSLVDLELLRVLDALHRERHVTNAAVRVGSSQPSMSRALARLRKVFGDELFVRTAHGMVPTPRADEIAPAARRVLESANALLREPEFDPATLERTFVIGSTDFLDADLLPALVHALRPSRGVSLVMRPLTKVGERLATGEVDVIVGVRGLVPDDAIAQHLFDERFACAVRRGHPRVKRSLTLATFVELEHVLIAPRGDGTSMVDDVLASRGLTRRITVRTHAFQSAPIVVARSDLILTAPRRILEAVAKPFDLVLFPPPIAVPPFEVVQAWHARMKRDPAHAWFRKIVATTARRSERP